MLGFVENDVDDGKKEIMVKCGVVFVISLRWLGLYVNIRWPSCRGHLLISEGYQRRFQLKGGPVFVMKS